MRIDKSKLVIGKDGIAACPECARENFELFDSVDAEDDPATFALRKVEGGFERKDPHGGNSRDSNWHAEARRVGCASCKRRESWPAYDLATGGLRVD